MTTKKFLSLMLLLLVIGSLVVMANDTDTPTTPTPIADNSLLEIYTDLELYQQYYTLQRQRDAADVKYDTRFTFAWQEVRSVKQQLASDSSDIELHRQLLRAQAEKTQSTKDWHALIKPIDEKMDAIRAELKNRGEPPPL